MRTRSPRKCPTCAKVLSNAFNLQRHMLCYHQRVKAFICRHCGHSFGYSHVLKAHVLIHQRQPEAEIASLTQMIARLPNQEYTALLGIR